MKNLLNFMGMLVGGWIGWQIGVLLSPFTAYLLGAVGTGAGLYAAQRTIKRLLP